MLLTETGYRIREVLKPQWGVFVEIVRKSKSIDGRGLAPPPCRPIMIEEKCIVLGMICDVGCRNEAPVKPLDDGFDAMIEYYLDSQIIERDADRVFFETVLAFLGDVKEWIQSCGDTSDDDAANGQAAQPNTAEQQAKVALPAPSASETAMVDPQPAKPKKLLTGWREITEALGKKNDNRDKVKSLNDRFGGPISSTGRGTKPMVYRDVLIDFWNNLAVKQQELANQARGKRLLTEDAHPYGRDGEVSTEISGSVKKPRSNAKR